jgi:Beta-lactamase superfamily domain
MRGVSVTHIGGPTVLIEVGGWRLLTDPTFDSPGRKYNFGWGTGSSKLTGPAIGAPALSPVDAVLLTHDHHDDNLDPAGRVMLPSAGVVVTTVSGAKRLGGNARGLEPWASWQLEAPGRTPIEILATPCRHGPPLARPIVGDVIGFAMRWPDQEHGALWVSGDTVLYSGVRRMAGRLKVTLFSSTSGGALSGDRPTSLHNDGPGSGSALRSGSPACCHPNSLRGMVALPTGARSNRAPLRESARRPPPPHPVGTDRRGR